jgi:hypothetical protein
MRKSISTHEDQTLRRQLRSEAMASSPVFSEALHRQIAAAVKQSRVQGVSSPMGQRSADRRLVQVLAACAACVLVAVVLGWPMVHRDGGAMNEPTAATIPSPATTEEAAIASLRSLDELAKDTANDLRGLVTATMVTPHSDDLKHDARLTAEGILWQLPINVETFAGPIEAGPIE